MSLNFSFSKFFNLNAAVPNIILHLHKIDGDYHTVRYTERNFIKDFPRSY